VRHLRALYWPAGSPEENEARNLVNKGGAAILLNDRLVGKLFL
jgi:hypothetical protein